MLAIAVASVVYAALNVWTGMDGFGVLVIGGSLGVKAFPSLMRRLGQRAVEVREGMTTRASTSFEFSPLVCAVYLPPVVFVTFLRRGDFIPASPWRGAVPVDSLLVGAWLAAAALMTRVAIDITPAAGSISGRRRAPGRQNSIAVVVVHGIGNQKAGGPLEAVAGSLEALLYRQAPGRVTVERKIGTEQFPRRVELRYAARIDKQRVKQRVVITEAFWADAERRPRRMQTLTWIIKSLPLLLLLSVAPDRQDIREPSFPRLFYRLAFPVLVIISLLQPSVRIWILLLLVAVAASTAFRSMNLLGDVQIAATRDEEVSEIVNEINSAIDAALSIAERVVVVGHSQGGYLSHRALELRAVTRGTKERIELIGIGSGLKPISLLKTFGDRRSVAMATSFLCSVLLMMVFVTPVLLGFIQGWDGLLDWMVRVNETLIEHVAAASLPSSAWHFTAWSHPMALVPDVWQIAALIGSVTLFFLMRRRIRPQILQLHQDLSRPGNVSRWTEITSSADTVGRLAWPHLARANVWNCPSLGQPLVDHISYYRRSSPVAWCLGATLFPSLIGDTVPVLRRWANYLDIRIRQARTLSMILGMILLAAYALDRLNPGARGINALLDQGKNPGGLFAGLLVITLMAPVLGIIDRHRLSAALDMRPMPSPPEVKQAPMWLRLFGLCVWVPFAASVAATAHDLVRYPNMVSTESRLLPVAPEVTAFLICLLAASLAAGYRFSTLTWSIVVLVVFWSTYLPGRGADFAAFVDGFMIITAIFFSVVYHFVARPIAVSSAEWPSFERGRAAGLRRSRVMPGS